MALKNSIDEQNKALLDHLAEKGVEISLAVEPDIPSWRVKTTYKISSPNDKANPAGLAHELLHIDLNLKGFADDNCTSIQFDTRNSAFSYEFVCQTNNNLAHFKMIDKFVSMGYSVDTFLQDTPKKYYLNSIIHTINALELKHETGTLEICKEILVIINLIAGTKLFELYKIKDPSTTQGLHPGIVLDPLKKINSELVSEIEKLFEDWYNTPSTNNLYFFQLLDIALKKHGIPTYDECNS
jgi:hypothetical protein